MLPGPSASEVTTLWRYTNLFIIIINLLLLFFLTPVLNSRGMKKLCYAIQKKYKNQAGMNLTPPPPPSQNSHAVRWHYYYYYYYYYYSAR